MTTVVFNMGVLAADSRATTRVATTIIQGGNDPIQALNNTWRKVKLKYDKKQLARRKSMGFSTNPNIKRGKPRKEPK